jgi:uncharacterized protein HemX
MTAAVTRAQLRQFLAHGALVPDFSVATGTRARGSRGGSFSLSAVTAAQQPVSPTPAPPTTPQTQGAAKGAAKGAAVGAVSGDAGKGAESGAAVGSVTGRAKAQRAKKQAEKQTQRQQQQQAQKQSQTKAERQQKLEGFKKGFSACGQLPGELSRLSVQTRVRCLLSECEKVSGRHPTASPR